MVCPLFVKKEECMNYWLDLNEDGQSKCINNRKNQEIFELKLIKIKQLRPEMQLRRFKLELKVSEESSVDDPLNMISEDSKDSAEVTSPFFGKTDDEPDYIFIDHIHYTGWPDDKAPLEEWFYKDIDELVEQIDKTRQFEKRIISSADFGTPSPVIVHCSAGVGRTGSLIAIYNMIESLRYTMHKNNFADILKSENN